MLITVFCLKTACVENQVYIITVNKKVTLLKKINVSSGRKQVLRVDVICNRSLYRTILRINKGFTGVTFGILFCYICTCKICHACIKRTEQILVCIEKDIVYESQSRCECRSIDVSVKCTCKLLFRRREKCTSFRYETSSISQKNL